MQNTNTILMVKPIQFTKNQETTLTNSFQKELQLSESEIQEKAITEFKGFVHTLNKYDINVITINDNITPSTPDSIFPNNWITFHPHIGAILYPMLTENRRNKRKLFHNILNTLANLDKQITNIYNLSYLENKGQYLEGTGSMVLDRVNKIAYIAKSPRSTAEAIKEFQNITDYQVITFQSQTADKTDIYHTNVMMSISEKFAVICLESLTNIVEKDKVLNSLKSTNHEIIDISLDQVHSFAGNMLEIKNNHGEKFLVLSKNAYKSLNKEQIKKLNKHVKLIPININTIETLGGGSARCMMAEIF